MKSIMKSTFQIPSLATEIRQVKQFCLILFVSFFSSISLFAQNSTEIIQQFLDQHHAEQQLTKADVSDWVISSHSKSKASGATHIYIQQQHQGIPVSNGVANFALKEGKVVSMGNRLISNLSAKANYNSPAINPTEAIEAAATHLELPSPTGLKVLEPISAKHFIYNN